MAKNMTGEERLFQNQMTESLARFRKLDLAERAFRLSAAVSGSSLVVPFFGQPHRISTGGVTGPGGIHPPVAVSVVLLDYVVRCPALVPEQGELISFRDFSDAGPLAVNFANNTHRLISHSFSGKRDRLIGACRKLAAQPAADDAFDLLATFQALPNVPVRLRFNDAEEGLPAQCGLLFYRSAEAWLSLQSRFVLGTYLAGTLTGFCLGFMTPPTGSGAPDRA